MPLSIPGAPGIVGATVGAQGALIDPAAGPHIGLTDGLVLTFGN